MARDVRLIVTDNSTAACTMAHRLAKGKVRAREVHRIPVWDAEDGDGEMAVIGLGGLLFAPAGDPPTWAPARRAPANALRLLARSAHTLTLATTDPLLATQAREVACEGRPLLMRAARLATPDGGLRHVDDLAAQARAVALEADAVMAVYLAPVDAELRAPDLAALGLAAAPARREVLRRAGVASESLGRLEERGYLVDDPAWRSPAGDLVCAAVDPSLLRPRPWATVAGWVDAVGRGTLSRGDALSRIRTLIGGMRPAERPAGLDAGRLVGRCPECADWMGGTRERIRCMGCGLYYRLPRQVEALAVPGRICEACDAPLIRPVVRGRRGEPRCPDSTGCPTRLDANVAR
jgi:hypothetical protein